MFLEYGVFQCTRQDGGTSDSIQGAGREKKARWDVKERGFGLPGKTEHERFAIAAPRHELPHAFRKRSLNMPLHSDCAACGDTLRPAVRRRNRPGFRDRGIGGACSRFRPESENGGDVRSRNGGKRSGRRICQAGMVDEDTACSALRGRCCRVGRNGLTAEKDGGGRRAAGISVEADGEPAPAEFVEEKRNRSGRADFELGRHAEDIAGRICHRPEIDRSAENRNREERQVMDGRVRAWRFKRFREGGGFAAERRAERGATVVEITAEDGRRETGRRNGVRRAARGGEKGRQVHAGVRKDVPPFRRPHRLERRIEIDGRSVRHRKPDPEMFDGGIEIPFPGLLVPDPSPGVADGSRQVMKSNSRRDSIRVRVRRFPDHAREIQRMVAVEVPERNQHARFDTPFRIGRQRKIHQSRVVASRCAEKFQQQKRLVGIVSGAIEKRSLGAAQKAAIGGECDVVADESEARLPVAVESAGEFADVRHRIGGKPEREDVRRDGAAVPRRRGRGEKRGEFFGRRRTGDDPAAGIGRRRR